MAVLLEGAIPPLAALARSGTPRAKAKVSFVLLYVPLNLADREGD
jgi:hypothetical protein